MTSQSYDVLSSIADLLVYSKTVKAEVGAEVQGRLVGQRFRAEMWGKGLGQRCRGKGVVQRYRAEVWGKGVGHRCGAKVQGRRLGSSIMHGTVSVTAVFL